jgi:hypothetical protein
MAMNPQDQFHDGIIPGMIAQGAPRVAVREPTRSSGPDYWIEPYKERWGLIISTASDPRNAETGHG